MPPQGRTEGRSQASHVLAVVLYWIVVFVTALNDLLGGTGYPDEPLTAWKGFCLEGSPSKSLVVLGVLLGSVLLTRWYLRAMRGARTRSASSTPDARTFDGIARLALLGLGLWVTVTVLDRTGCQGCKKAFSYCRHDVYDGTGESDWRRRHGIKP